MAQNGLWYNRRIMPYRTPDNGVEGIVITFAEITERKLASNTMEAAKRHAELATIAKSRFLAAASHDLRQPLQALVLLQGLLAKSVKGDDAQKLLTRFDATLGSMSGMLNALLDINQIEAGDVRAEKVTFPINFIFEQLKGEFTEQAQSQGLVLKVVPSSLTVNTDPRLLEQMIRSLLSNALKYTGRGKILLGCRRREGKTSIEVWDSGIGIAKEEFQAIFHEYHQIDNAARERGRGLGLGLFIVRQLATLLGHDVHVRSRTGIGSVFSIDIVTDPAPAEASLATIRPSMPFIGNPEDKKGLILLVEDDEELRRLLELSLTRDGYDVKAASDGSAALKRVAEGMSRPDLVLADYNLPLAMNGLQLAAELRRIIHRDLPVIILTGDISTGTLSAIADQQCVQLNKPVKTKELVEVIGQLLQTRATVKSGVNATPKSDPLRDTNRPVVFVVDDDQQIRDAFRDVLEDDGRQVECYADSESFLDNYHSVEQSCLVVDAYLPGMSGVELLQKLNETGKRPAAIMITGNSDVSMAVMAMKAGALDFIEKPVNSADLIASVSRALEQSQDSSKQLAWRDTAAKQVAALTSRQREIMELVLAGHPSKNIAADLGISQRTVENHRASIMKRTGSKSLPALARLALLAKSEA